MSLTRARQPAAICPSGRIGSTFAPEVQDQLGADLYLVDELQPKTRPKNRGSRNTNPAEESTASDSLETNRFEELSATYISEELDAAYRILNQEGKLTVKILETQDEAMVLQSLAPDSFRNALGEFEFSRDGLGNVNGFILNSGRVKGLRFERQSQ